MAGESLPTPTTIFMDIADVFSSYYKQNATTLSDLVKGIQYDNRMMRQFLYDHGLSDEYEQWLEVEKAYGRDMLNKV